MGSYGGEEAAHLFPTKNAAASALIYEIDPKEMLAVSTGRPRRWGRTSWGCSTPTPTPTPTRRRPTWPRRSIRAGTTCWSRCEIPIPVVRSYTIVDGCHHRGAGRGARAGGRDAEGCIRILTRSVNNHLTCHARVHGEDQTRRPRGRRSPPTHRPAHATPAGHRW